MKRIHPAATAASAAFIFLASGLVACSSEQPKPQNPPAQGQTENQQPGQVPAQAPCAQPGQAALPGQQPGMVPPANRQQLGVVSEMPSTSQIPTEKTVIDRQQIPTVTVTRVGGDINRMTAPDFKALGLTGDLAQSVIQYRDAHGAFKSVKDLSKVPNMDQNWLADTQDQLAVTPSSATG